MAKNYMVTMPRDDRKLALKLIRYINSHDIHKWVIGAETGRNGYKHWQCRLRAPDDFFQIVTIEKVSYKTGWLAQNIPEAHCEECSDKWEYEIKEGHYIASWDTMEARRQRFGKVRWAQKGVIEAVYKTNDREIVYWYDETGNIGKSWLTGYLFESAQAYYLPPFMTSIQSMIQTLASMVLEDRKGGFPPRPLVVIDIPRSWKWSTELYVAIEAIKDGLIIDPRYSARPINIRGIKVLILTNTMPKLDKLSKDRWVQYDPVLHEMIWGKPEEPSQP